MLVIRHKTGFSHSSRIQKVFALLGNRTRPAFFVKNAITAACRSSSFSAGRVKAAAPRGRPPRGVRPAAPLPPPMVLGGGAAGGPAGGRRRAAPPRPPDARSGAKAPAEGPADPRRPENPAGKQPEAPPPGPRTNGGGGGGEDGVRPPRASGRTPAPPRPRRRNATNTKPAGGGGGRGADRRGDAPRRDGDEARNPQPTKHSITKCVDQGSCKKLSICNWRSRAAAARPKGRKGGKRGIPNNTNIVIKW